MKAMVVKQANGPFELEERPTPEPGPGQVRVKVEACGICHSDALREVRRFPPASSCPAFRAMKWPARSTSWGTAWTTSQWATESAWAGTVVTATSAQHAAGGLFINCANEKICGVSYDGGYAEYMVAPWEALARIPNELSAAEAGPLLCAGITTYNSLRNSGARPGDVVAVQGIGGLGHLAVQYARRMGFRTVALSRGTDKKALAEKLGAHHYVDAKAENPAEALQALGGADVILATAPNAKAIESVIAGLSSRGQAHAGGGCP